VVAAAPSEAQPPAASAPPAETTLAIEFNGTSWVDIRDSTGQHKLSGTFRAGTRRELGGKPPYSVSIGNYKAVVLRANGEAVDLRPHFNGSIVRFSYDPQASADD
jgi:cytoskeleton protein RodZ